MPDIVYGWSLWWLNWFHVHPVVWWSFAAASILINLPRFTKKG